VRALVGSYALHPDTNNLSVSLGADVQDASVVGSTFHEKVLGMTDGSVDFSGFVDYYTGGEVQTGLQTLYEAGGSNVVSLGVEAGAAVGTVSYFGTGIISTLSKFGGISDVAPFNLTVELDDLFRGRVLGTQSGVTTTGVEAGYQLGAATSAQTIRSALHVFAVSGTTPTLDVVVESDTADTWGGAETTRITHTQATAVTSQLSTLVGPVTDTWWRITYTIGGGSPVFSFFHSLAIAAT